MKLFDWIFDEKKEVVTKPHDVIDMTKVVINGKTVYVDRPVSSCGFAHEAKARNYDAMDRRFKAEQRIMAHARFGA